VAAVPDEVAIAMAEGIDGALAEATAEPAPAGTLEFQAEAMAEAATEAAPAVEPEVALAAADLPEVAVVESEAAPVEVAAADLAAISEAPGTFEAQAAALASGAAPAETALPPVEEVAAVAEPDPALAEMKPKARPEGMTVQLATVEPVAEPEPPVVEEVVVAEAEPEPELVVTDPGTEVAAAEPETLLADVSAVETVAAPATVGPAPVELAAVIPATKRSAPIFDAVETVEPVASEADEEVVVVMSTSGGRHFGVNVGEYPSRYEAEKALLKTALAESATLNDGLRKTTQSGGAWRASFMGLTEEQAELACRRLTARAVPCETVGG
jgi:D-alanyl-D-alanine carboxypeptidase